MGILVLLPHQLFDPDYFPSDVDIDKVILYEHPHYFTGFKYNKKKLLLHRASMQAYKDELKGMGYKVEYVEYKDKITIKNEYEIIMFDWIDKIESGIVGKKGKKIDMLFESPNFLVKKKQCKEYSKRKGGGGGGIRFNGFYMYGKKLVDIIPGVKSKDKYNRERIDKGVKIIGLSKIEKCDQDYIKEAEKYVEKNFKGNYGSVKGFRYPVCRKTAWKWFLDFVKKKMSRFGKYQDFIMMNEDYLFHSVLSMVINIGLINPDQIIDYLRKDGIKKKVGINNYEGYIRQLFWREYQRYCYWFINWKKIGNYFGNKKVMGKEWYVGGVGNKVVDDMIVKGFENGYLHHIERLMIIGNYMNLSGIRSGDGFKWFMEFSCDSYLWVMYQNVYEMVFFRSGGKTTRKPYVSSSNYILKMSDYPRGEWSDEWDEMYKRWVMKNKKKLWKFRYHFPMLTKK